MKNVLRAKNKFKFIDGTLKKQDASAPEVSHLMIYNSMVAYYAQAIDSDLYFDLNGPNLHQRAISATPDILE